MSLPFEVRCLLSHGGARVIGILRTMCHDVITDVTVNHRLRSRTVRVLPVRQFAVRSSLNTHTRTEIDLICTEVVMYRYYPPLCTETDMYRK